MDRVDLDRPRQAGRMPVELLVGVVAQRPSAWARMSPGAMQSATVQNESFARRQAIQVPSIPPSTAPQMPRPPCQIAGVSDMWWARTRSSR